MEQYSTADIVNTRNKKKVVRDQLQSLIYTDL